MCGASARRMHDVGSSTSKAVASARTWIARVERSRSFLARQEVVGCWRCCSRPASEGRALHGKNRRGNGLRRTQALQRLGDLGWIFAGEAWVRDALRKRQQAAALQKRPPKCFMAALARLLGDGFYFSPALFWSRALKSSSVPTTWPLRVPGIMVLSSMCPDFALAMVMLLTSSVRPRARS